jgi:hypothetical protein
MAHDPMAPEYWPTTFPVGQVDENLNGTSTGEWFAWIGAGASLALFILLPKLFDGEMNTKPTVSKISQFVYQQPVKFTLMGNEKELCLRLTFPIG